MDDRATLSGWAEQQAHGLLAPLGTRWLHVQRVVSTAHEIEFLFQGTDREHLLAAVYLHDVGYAPTVAQTGFHPLDGALYVKQFGHSRLAALIAHHSEARFEAQARGLSEELARFPRERSPVADALTYCDQLADSTGKRVTLHERRMDILARYGEEHLVYQTYCHAFPYLALAVARTQRRLQRAGISA